MIGNSVFMQNARYSMQNGNQACVNFEANSNKNQHFIVAQLLKN